MEPKNCNTKSREELGRYQVRNLGFAFAVVDTAHYENPYHEDKQGQERPEKPHPGPITEQPPCNHSGGKAGRFVDVHSTRINAVRQARELNARG